MSTAATAIKHEDLPKEMWALLNTLSDEAQAAAHKKAKELGFDVSKGKISLEESFINLSQARDTLYDAVEKEKLIQWPLKIQYQLFDDVAKVARFLSSLANGTDEILNIEASVEDLTAAVWQFNLQNLTGQVLGFQTKMNQLKAQEALIRRISRDAEDFKNLKDTADLLMARISSIAQETGTEIDKLKQIVGDATILQGKCIEFEQRIAAISNHVQQSDAVIDQQVTKGTTASADIESRAKKAQEDQAQIDQQKELIEELLASGKEQHQSLVASSTETITSLQKHLEVLRDEKSEEISELRNKTETALDTAVANVQKLTAEADERVNDLVSETSARLKKTEESHEGRLEAQLSDFGVKSQTALTQSSTAFTSKLKELTTQSEVALTNNDAETKKLIATLEQLEARIHESIERATGYTLFHSFQRRQLDVASSKRFWGYALGALVLISLGASAYFIHYLQYVQTYNAAFYLKLSISVPLIYAIAFCNLQYSRERRLEEEYAFKSNISISLDPYQKLVGDLVDKQKPEELAKYTAFIIDSVNRVFTSPTEKIFDEHPRKDTAGAENLIKSLGEFVEPLLKALKKE